MKTTITLLLCCFSFVAIAQFNNKAPWMGPFNNPSRTVEPTFNEVVDAFEAYWVDKDETVKGSGYKPFKRWESLYKDYLNPDGRVMTATQQWKAWRAVSKNRDVQEDDSDWQNIGPLAHTNSGSWSSGQGRVNTSAIDPSNPNIYYVGTPAGGIWKSIDAGNSWEPLSDELPQIGVSGIAIDPTNSNVIYIATGDDDAGDSYSVGVMKSENGGATWNFTGLDESNSPDSMNEIYIDPDNNQTIWVATTEGVFKSIDAGDTWVNKRTGNFDDLVLKPGDSSILYAATGNVVYRSTDGGEQWESISTGVLSGTARLELGVTLANADVLYIFSTDFSYGTGKIYKSSDGGDTFNQTFDGGQDIFEASQAWYDFAFAVSDTNENEIFTGVLNIWKSTNSGANFSKVNEWFLPGSASYTHADIHDLRFINGKLFCGSDGGIYMSEDSGTNFTSLTEGLAIGQFYKIDVAEEDASIVVGGLQDNGGYARNNDTWYNYYGADGMEVVVDPTDSENIFGFIQSGGGPYLSQSGGLSLDDTFNAPESGEWITPLTFSADDRLYAGYSRVYEFNRCNENWVPKSNSLGQDIRHLATHPINPAILYASIGSRLYRSTDSGTNFTQINSFSNTITSIDIQYGLDAKVYVVTSGSNGRVYEGTASGNDLSLVDITGDLPDIPKLVIKQQASHQNTILYLGTSIGVWRYDSSLGIWEAFQNSLPNTAVRDLDINEAEGILTAGTYGRGIWQTSIEKGIVEDDIAISRVDNAQEQVISCANTSIFINVRNNGASELTEARVDYMASGVEGSFNWTGNLAPEEEITIEVPSLDLAPGTYSYQVTFVPTSDQVLENNILMLTLAVNQAGVYENVYQFEGEQEDFLALSSFVEVDPCSSQESTSIWERGTPAGVLLNQTISGVNAYATNLNGSYESLSKEYLVTPCFDLTGTDDPVMAFAMAYDLEADRDVAYIEYSTDQENTWNTLGSAIDANWYTSSETSEGDCETCVGAQWTGQNTNMFLYRYNLSDLKDEGTIVFRFVLHSDDGINGEGLVIDDLRITDATLSTEDIEGFPGLSIYPNPSTGQFTIRFPQGSELSYTVYDILGKTIVPSTRTTVGNLEHTIDMKLFAQGMYIINIQQDDKQLIKKLILN